MGILRLILSLCQWIGSQHLPQIFASHNQVHISYVITLEISTLPSIRNWNYMIAYYIHLHFCTPHDKYIFLYTVASQMMTLIRLLPFMVGDLIEEEDEHWDCFLLLWDICSLVCAYEVTQNDSLHLAWLVQTYLESFKDLYGGSSITPKMHHLVHLPEQILLWVTYKLTGLSHKCCTFVSYKQGTIAGTNNVPMSLIHANIFSIMLLSISGNRILMEISILSPVRFGPLKNQWCMRYESKNAQMKRFVSRSFKNVPLTVAIHHQQWMLPSSYPSWPSDF